MTEDQTLPYWAQRIQELTERSGLAQAELARRSGLTRDAFNRYHSGRTRPPDKLLALADLFAVHPNDIDPDAVTLRKRSDARSAEPYRVGKASNGNPDFVHLQLNVDLHISAMSQILEIVNEEIRRAEV
ncbi:MAG: helix-turn-helix domain-containing protein [Pseudomonadota bacterium]